MLGRRRRILGSIAGVALAVLVASCFVGVRVIHVSSAWQETGVFFGRAAVRVACSDGTLHKDLPDPGWRVEVQPVFTPPGRIDWAPSFAHHGPRSPGGWSGVLPLWPVPVVAGGVWLWRWRRAAARPAHACQGCGYDLRGAKAGVCPECGAAVVETGGPTTRAGETAPE